MGLWALLGFAALGARAEEGTREPSIRDVLEARYLQALDFTWADLAFRELDVHVERQPDHPAGGALYDVALAPRGRNPIRAFRNPQADVHRYWVRPGGNITRIVVNPLNGEFAGRARISEAIRAAYRRDTGLESTEEGPVLVYRHSAIAEGTVYEAAAANLREDGIGVRTLAHRRGPLRRYVVQRASGELVAWRERGTGPYYAVYAMASEPGAIALDRLFMVRLERPDHWLALRLFLDRRSHALEAPMPIVVGDIVANDGSNATWWRWSLRDPALIAANDAFALANVHTSALATLGEAEAAERNGSARFLSLEARPIALLNRAGEVIAGRLRLGMPGSDPARWLPATTDAQRTLADPFRTEESFDSPFSEMRWEFPASSAPAAPFTLHWLDRNDEVRGSRTVDGGPAGALGFARSAGGRSHRRHLFSFSLGRWLGAEDVDVLLSFRHDLPSLVGRPIHFGGSSFLDAPVALELGIRNDAPTPARESAEGVLLVHSLTYGPGGHIASLDAEIVFRPRGRDTEAYLVVHWGADCRHRVAAPSFRVDVLPPLPGRRGLR